MKNSDHFRVLHIVSSYGLDAKTLPMALAIARGVDDEGVGPRLAKLGEALRVESIPKLIAMAVARGLEALEREQAEKAVSSGE